MSNVGKVLSDKAAIANWEDEGGALKPVFVPDIKPRNTTRIIWLGSLITLPFLFWLAKREFQK